MPADQKEHAAQMKLLTHLVPALSTAPPKPPAPRERCRKKTTAHFQKLQEDMDDSRRHRGLGVIGELSQTLDKHEEKPQIGSNVARRKER